MTISIFLKVLFIVYGLISREIVTFTETFGIYIVDMATLKSILIPNDCLLANEQERFVIEMSQIWKISTLHSSNEFIYGGQDD